MVSLISSQTSSKSLKCDHMLISKWRLRIRQRHLSTYRIVRAMLRMASVALWEYTRRNVPTHGTSEEMALSISITNTWCVGLTHKHYSDAIMRTMASQITSVSVVCSTVCLGADQRKHQSSVSLAFVRGVHRSPVDSRKMFPFDDVIMFTNLPQSHIITSGARWLSKRHLGNQRILLAVSKSYIQLLSVILKGINPTVGSLRQSGLILGLHPANERWRYFVIYLFWHQLLSCVFAPDLICFLTSGYTCSKM